MYIYLVWFSDFIRLVSGESKVKPDSDKQAHFALYTEIVLVYLRIYNIVKEYT